MKVTDFNYNLPEELIAQTPLGERTQSRLLAVAINKASWRELVFANIIDELQVGDTLVLNDSRVIPARLIGSKQSSGGKVELLLLKPLADDHWEVLVKPGRKARLGGKIEFGNGELTADIIDNTTAGGRVVKFNYQGIFQEVLERLGEMPLPPYITEKLSDKERYQTVYAKHNGSVAAPTAGLHFSKELLMAIKAKGVSVTSVTLHVGLGTFRPVQAELVTEHTMHSEFYQLSDAAAAMINRTKANNGRVIAIGTTSMRVLESVADQQGLVNAGSGWTDIFIYPGYKFKLVDGLLTNFHLPKSTLLMLVSAFAGSELIRDVYNFAIEKRLRFFSFGDAMLLMRGATIDNGS